MLVWLQVMVVATIAFLWFVDVTFSRPSIYLVPAWVAVVSIVLLVRRPQNLEPRAVMPSAGV